MAYVPTYDEIPAPKAELTSDQQGGYVPSYADIPDPRPIPPHIHTGIGAQAASLLLAPLSGIAEGTRQLGQLAVSPLNYAVHELGGPAHLIQLPKASFTQALNLPRDAPLEQLGEVAPALVGADVSAPLTGLKALGEAIPGLTRGMAAQAAGGAAYGAGAAQAQGRNVPIGFATGAGLGAAGGAAGELLGMVGRPIGRVISRDIVSPLAKKASALITQDEPPISALTPLGDRLNAARAKASQWGPELKEAAAKADKGKPFDNAHYKETALNILKDLKEGENEDPDTYTPLVEAVQKKLDFLPSSYKSAVAQRSALNQMPSTWELTNKSMANRLKGISGEMKGALDEQIDKNAQDNPAAKDLADKWQEHRRNYQFLKSFDQTPVAMRNQQAILKYSKPQAETLAGPIPTESTLQHFLPVGKDKDTLKMEHLGNLIGNQPLARQALKEEYLAGARDGDGSFNAPQLLNRYKKLSKKQQDYFFSSEEQTFLNSALKARGASKTAAARHIVSHYGTPMGLGAVAGGLIGEHEGEGWGKGAVTGAALGGTLGLLPKLFISPGGAAIGSRLAQQGFNRRAFAYPLSAGGLGLMKGG